jgi:hypothetical protein
MTASKQLDAHRRWAIGMIATRSPFIGSALKQRRRKFVDDELNDSDNFRAFAAEVLVLARRIEP